MYCSCCGAKLTDNAEFCGTCGAHIENTESPMPQEKGKHMKANKKVIIVAGVILVAVVIALLSLLGGGSNRADFNIEYSPSGVEEFLNIVCKNVDGEYAKVIDPNYDGPAGNSCYTAVVEVKRNGSVAETVQMRFFNQYDSDMVKSGRVYFYDSDSDNEFECRKAFVMALEITLCGESYAGKYLTGVEGLEDRILSGERSEEVVIAEYELTDELYVEIIGERNLGWDWTVEYNIYKTK